MPTWSSWTASEPSASVQCSPRPTWRQAGHSRWPAASSPTTRLPPWPGRSLDRGAHCHPLPRAGHRAGPSEPGGYDMKAVIYAAKSTEDVHGSLPDQLRDCRIRAEREGWEVVGEEKDEKFSAYHG